MLIFFQTKIFRLEFTALTTKDAVRSIILLCAIHRESFRFFHRIKSFRDLQTLIKAYTERLSAAFKKNICKKIKKKQNVRRIFQQKYTNAAILNIPDLFWSDKI